MPAVLRTISKTAFWLVWQGRHTVNFLLQGKRRGIVIENEEKEFYQTSGSIACPIDSY